MCSIGLLVLLNETTDQQHRCLLSFLFLAGKPSLIIGETVAYHLCTEVFMVWLVFPPHLFVVLPSPLVKLMASHFVSCPLELILTSTPSILVPLLTGMPSRHLWILVLPVVRFTVQCIPAWPTPSNHTPIPTVTGGPGDIVLDGDPAPSTVRGTAAPISGPCLLWPNGRPSQLLLSCCDDSLWRNMQAAVKFQLQLSLWIKSDWHSLNIWREEYSFGTQQRI